MADAPLWVDVLSPAVAAGALIYAGYKDWRTGRREKKRDERADTQALAMQDKSNDFARDLLKEQAKVERKRQRDEKRDEGVVKILRKLNDLHFIIRDLPPGKGGLEGGSVLKLIDDLERQVSESILFIPSEFHDSVNAYLNSGAEFFRVDRSKDALDRMNEMYAKVLASARRTVQDIAQDDPGS